jgi:hypothetical protein
MAISQEINIFVKTKQGGNSPQIFPNWRLLPNRQRSLDLRRIYKDSKIFTWCSMNRPLDWTALHVNLPKQLHTFYLVVVNGLTC